MRAKLISVVLVGAAVAISGCARESGGGEFSERYGQSNDLVFARQVAYKTPDDFLTDLGRVFAAETQDTVTFAFNSSRLDSTAREALRGQAAWLRANPEVRMTVTGHADAVGGETFNQRLGLRRARNVVGYLVSRGVSRSRLDAVESRGETELVVDTPNRERRNRRAVTTVAGFVRNFVGDGMDGRVANDLFRVYLEGNAVGDAAATQ